MEDRRWNGTHDTLRNDRTIARTTAVLKSPQSKRWRDCERAAHLLSSIFYLLQSSLFSIFASHSGQMPWVIFVLELAVMYFSI